MSSDLLSRNLDTIPITTEELNDKTCEHRRVYIQHPQGDPHTAAEIGDSTPPCGKPATHIVLKTCCGDIAYQCTAHAEPFSGNVTATTCLACRHRCVKGVCCHRIATPL